MKRYAYILLSVAAVFSMAGCKSEKAPKTDLPREVYVGQQAQHVQGIAYDEEKNCMYMSFTSRFVKVDMQGNILGSIDRIQGHLGAMTFDPVGICVTRMQGRPDRPGHRQDIGRRCGQRVGVLYRHNRR